MPDALDDRLRAVERALDESADRAASVTRPADDSTADPACSQPATARHGHDDPRLDDLESRLDDAEETLAELDAAVQALRGYAGKVRSVDERVEERADAALAAVESVEERVDALEAAETERGEPSRRRGDRREPAARRGSDTTAHEDATLDAEWPTSPAPQFAREDGDDDTRPGFLARLRDLL